MSKKGILVSAVLGFCLWLAGGEVLAQTAPVHPFTVKETAKEGANKGEWEVTTEVKNNTPNKETIVFWSWPAAQGGAKIGDLKWHPAGTVPESPTPTDPNHKVPKKSQGTTNPGVEIPGNGGTVSMTETRKTKPHTSYVRVFKKLADGSWKQQEPIVAHNVHLLAFHVPNTDPVSEYLTIPVRIPYATDLANATNGAPLNFFVKSVSVPAGWQTTYLTPALGERFTLQSTQREFSGVHVVRMIDPLPEGGQAVVNVTWGVEDQDGEIIDYETTIRNLVMKDNTPPAVSLWTEPRPDGTFVRIDVSDPGGIHHNAQLQVTRNGPSGRSREILVVPFTRVLQQDPQSEIGATHAQFETTLRSCGQETLTLVASAVDQFGNSAASGPVSVTVDADAADAAADAVELPRK
ncbi:MAG TPA: hypothetical protein VF789_25500 [Thermoanaerobaculia bacterium]